MRPPKFYASLCLSVAASTAWPAEWRSPLEAVKREPAPLVLRQDAATTSKFDLSYTGAQGNTATTVASSTATLDEVQKLGSTESSKGSKTTETFDARLPAGGVQMITPSAAATSYYKIKDYVTFAWNYTSLSATPSAVDILASCSLNSATYTIAMNQSITGASQAVTWDTNEFQQTASTTLLTGTYTLIIHDAAKDVTAAAQAGYLATFEQFTFGMYQPQSYTPMADYVCATCNAALSLVERQTLGFMFSMAGLTVLSFGWFGGVAGLW